MAESTNEKAPQYDNDYWSKEIAAAQKNVADFHKQSRKVVKRFVDDRDEAQNATARLNLFYANITTLRSLLYGRMPKVDVSRRYNDYNDDQARVASIMMERILNADVQADSHRILRQCLDDKLIAGLGIARVRYEAEFEEEEIEAIMDEEGNELAPAYTDSRVEDEAAPIDYIHWEDFLWSPARTWSEVRWVAFRAWMTEEQVRERFGDTAAQSCSYTSQDKNLNAEQDELLKNDPTRRAQVWEIWCKDTKMAHWYSQGTPALLDEQPDPLELKDFFPCPCPMAANVTTSAFIPKADYLLAQDLYLEIDNLETRIMILTSAVKAVGVYDEANEGIQRIFTEGVDNDLIPVKNFAAFSEKGGTAGAIDWVPIKDVVDAIINLKQLRDDAIALLYQITGMSDILRGAGSQGGVTAAEQQLKAKFASVRVQFIQEDFARFASELLALKGEVVSKHFQDQTIITESNIQYTPDAQLAPQAISLLREQYESEWRISIKPESLAMIDYATVRQERMEFIQAVGFYTQSMGAIAEKLPQSLPMMLELLKWGLSGFKGADEVEGVMDRAVEGAKAAQAQAAAQPPQPSPEQVKAQAEAARQQQEFQQESTLQNTAFQQEMLKQRQKFDQEMKTIRAKTVAEMAKQKAQAIFDFRAEMAKMAKEQKPQ